VRGNKPPTLSVKEIKSRNVKIGEPLTIATEVKDDGIPKPRNLQRVAAAQARAAGQSTDAQPASAPPAATTSPATTSGAAPAPPASGAAAVAGAILGRNPAMVPPTRITVGKNLGLHTSWFLYRGPAGGKVTFDPPQVKAWEDTRAGANSPWAPLWSAPHLAPDGKEEVHVTFSAPGTYVLRCRADDGALVADEEVTIVVTR